jgi:hypothetical protein
LASEVLIRDGTFVGRRNLRRILGENAAMVARFGLLPLAEAAVDFFLRHIEIDLVLLGVDCDAVAVFSQSQSGRRHTLPE